MTHRCFSGNVFFPLTFRVQNVEAKDIGELAISPKNFLPFWCPAKVYNKKDLQQIAQMCLDMALKQRWKHKNAACFKIVFFFIC